MFLMLIVLTIGGKNPLSAVSRLYEQNEFLNTGFKVRIFKYNHLWIKFHISKHIQLR